MAARRAGSRRPRSSSRDLIVRSLVCIRLNIFRVMLRLEVASTPRLMQPPGFSCRSLPILHETQRIVRTSLRLEIVRARALLPSNNRRGAKKPRATHNGYEISANLAPGVNKQFKRGAFVDARRETRARVVSHHAGKLQTAKTMIRLLLALTLVPRAVARRRRNNQVPRLQTSLPSTGGNSK